MMPMPFMSECYHYAFVCMAGSPKYERTVQNCENVSVSKSQPDQKIDKKLTGAKVGIFVLNFQRKVVTFRR